MQYNVAEIDVLQRGDMSLSLLQALVLAWEPAAAVTLQPQLCAKQAEASRSSDEEGGSQACAAFCEPSAKLQRTSAVAFTCVNLQYQITIARICDSQGSDDDADVLTTPAQKTRSTSPGDSPKYRYALHTTQNSGYFLPLPSWPKTECLVTTGIMLEVN